MSNANENNKLILTQKESGLVRVGNSVAITNRLLNQEISDYFNQGFCKLNSKKIKSVDSDYLLELEHSSNYQIVKKYDFEAQHHSDYEQALNFFNQVLILKPNHSLTYTMIGIYYWSQQRRIFSQADDEDVPIILFVKPALRRFNQAIEVDSFNALAFYFLAAVYRCSDHYEFNDLKAVEAVNRAIEIDEKFCQAYLLRGAAMESLGDKLGAIADFTKAIELDSTYAAAYYRRGMLRKKLNEFSEAIDDFTKAMDLDTKYVSRCSREQGQMKLHLGYSEGAKQDFERDSTRAKINYFKNKYGDSNS
jgi:tetratricopeptide (TPR) repeat protein